MWFLMTLFCLCGACWFGFCASGINVKGSGAWAFLAAASMLLLLISASLACLVAGMMASGVLEVPSWLK